MEDPYHHRRARKSRILVIYEDGAGGHRAAASALSEALEETALAEAPIFDIDTVAPRIRKTAYCFFMNIKPLLGPIHRLGFRLRLRSNPLLSLALTVGSVLQPWSLRRFLDVVKDYAPDLIIATHFRPIAALNKWREQGRLKVRVHVVIPDFVAHGLYARPNIDRYYVATDVAKQDLKNTGIPSDRISVTGIPVLQSVLRNDARPREELRQGLGLSPHLPVLLLMGGSRGDGNYAPVLRVLDAHGMAIQVVALCGRNSAMKANMDAISTSKRISLHSKSYQSNMGEWYRAADLIMTKPGGMTSAECLALSKPILFSYPRPGQEELQAERLVAAGAALYERSPRQAVEAALRILGDPAAQRRMAGAATTIGKPNAARDIASEVISAVRKG